MRLGAVKAIVTRLYSDVERSVATIMPPMVDMTVGMVEPQKRLNPPLAETLAILISLVTGVFSYLVSSIDIYEVAENFWRSFSIVTGHVGLR